MLERRENKKEGTYKAGMETQRAALSLLLSLDPRNEELCFPSSLDQLTVTYSNSEHPRLQTMSESRLLPSCLSYF